VSARRRRPEDAIQRALVAHYKLRAAPGVFMFAVPNGGWRSKIEAAIMRGTGTVAGVPDTIWIKGGQIYGLEVKAPGRRATEAQLATIAAMEKAGALYCVAVGIDEALTFLEQHGLLKGRAS
jgi:hypothetical protein